MILLALCLPFVAVNFLWVSFVLQLKFDTPEYISVFVIDALRGAGQKIAAKTGPAAIRKTKEGAKKGLQKSKQLGQEIARRSKRGRRQGGDIEDKHAPVIEPKDSDRQNNEE